MKILPNCFCKTIIIMGKKQVLEILNLSSVCIVIRIVTCIVLFDVLYSIVAN